MVRMILVLVYWVLPNIGQYWLRGDIFIGCHTQYQYCSDTVVPAVCQSPVDDDREIGKEVTKSYSSANEGTHNERQQTDTISFYNIHGHFNSHSMDRRVLYTCTHDLLNNQYSASLCTAIGTGYWYRQYPIIISWYRSNPRDLCHLTQKSCI